MNVLRKIISVATFCRIIVYLFLLLNYAFVMLFFFLHIDIWCALFCNLIPVIFLFIRAYLFILEERNFRLSYGWAISYDGKFLDGFSYYMQSVNANDICLLEFVYLASCWIVCGILWGFNWILLSILIIVSICEFILFVKWQKIYYKLKKIYPDLSASKVICFNILGELNFKNPEFLENSDIEKIKKQINKLVYENKLSESEGECYLKKLEDAKDHSDSCMDVYWNICGKFFRVLFILILGTIYVGYLSVSCYGIQIISNLTQNKSPFPSYFVDESKYGFHFLIWIAEHGNADACCELAKYYDYTKKDTKNAIKWYTKAYSLGKQNASQEIGLIFSLQKNYPMAVKWYSIAVSGNPDNIDLIENLANACFDNKDYQSAIKYYTKCVELGRDKSYSIGDCYSWLDEWSKAIVFWEKAAAHGNYWGAYNIGSCYENGFGVSKDLEKSKYWYKKAADQGNKKAQEALRRLEKQQPISK